MSSASTRLVHLAASTALASLITAASVQAQGFNVDFNAAFPTAGLTPPSTYAAAGTAGTWNGLTGGAPGVFPLVDKAGAPSSATLTLGATFFASLEFDNLNFVGDDAALMEDIVYHGGGAGATDTITVSGLAAGTYDVITYAQAPDSKINFITNISVVGSADPVQGVGGTAWAGTHVLGASHARHQVTVAAGGDIVVNVAVGTSFDSVNGLQIEPAGATGTAYCFGDGSGAVCPCASFGGAGEGCLTTSGSGATLAGSGSANIGVDSFVLSVSGAPANKPGLFFQGNNQIGIAAGDGLLCAAGATIRYAVNSTDASGAVSQGGFAVNASAGQTLNYQYWFRDTGNPCGGGFNFTNGWSQPWN